MLSREETIGNTRPGLMFVSFDLILICHGVYTQTNRHYIGIINSLFKITHQPLTKKTHRNTKEKQCVYTVATFLAKQAQSRRFNMVILLVLDYCLLQNMYKHMLG